LGKRASRRRRGKRKEALKKLTAEQKLAWDKLRHVKKDEPEIPSIIIPIIRRVMPSLIANSITGVQPLRVPEITTKEMKPFQKYLDEFKKL